MRASAFKARIVLSWRQRLRAVLSQGKVSQFLQESLPTTTESGGGARPAGNMNGHDLAPREGSGHARSWGGCSGSS